MTIIFSLKHVFKLVDYATKKIIDIGYVVQLKSAKNEPTPPKVQFGGGGSAAKLHF